VQTCSKCNKQSHDTATHCGSCKSDLSEYSATAVALKKFKENPRVNNIRLVVGSECCPVCAAQEGTYEKDTAPILPIEGCSHPQGCRCFYEPMLNVIYP
jgi:hypothetical protein